MATIFISYRRADSASETGRLYDRLVERYGRAQIFKDVDSIPAGVDFPEYIAESIQASDVALVVIGSRWLTASSGFAQRRLDDAADFVRVEIVTALRLGVPVIPVLVGGAVLPSARRLPENLRPLLRQNGLQLRQDPDFSHDVERIVAAIDYWQAQPRRPIALAIPESDPQSTPAPAVSLAVAPATPPPAFAKAPTKAPTESTAPSATARWLPRPRLSLLLIALSALVVIAVSVALLLNGTAGAFFGQRGQQPTQTTDPSYASTHTVAAVTETAQAKIDTQAYSPQGGPGLCAPADEIGSALQYWSGEASCVNGRIAQISAGQTLIFAGRPYSSGNFPISFEMDVTMNFENVKAAGDCALLIVQYEGTGSKTNHFYFCRDGTWGDASHTRSFAATPPYNIKLTLTSTTISLRVNGESLLSNAPNTGQVTLMSFDAQGASCVVDISNFTLIPQQT